MQAKRSILSVSLFIAHLKHGVSRAIIFDIDLHHGVFMFEHNPYPISYEIIIGNGTQSIAWQINEEAYRKDLESHYAPSETSKPSLRVFYGSMHDILSFPCEVREAVPVIGLDAYSAARQDGQPGLVQAASTSLHGPHGQYIENIHLSPYLSEDHFWNVLYKERYSVLFDKARAFVQDTSGENNDIIVFIR